MNSPLGLEVHCFNYLSCPFLSLSPFFDIYNRRKPNYTGGSFGR